MTDVMTMFFCFVLSLILDWFGLVCQLVTIEHMDSSLFVILSKINCGITLLFLHRFASFVN